MSRVNFLELFFVSAPEHYFLCQPGALLSFRFVPSILATEMGVRFPSKHSFFFFFVSWRKKIGKFKNTREREKQTNKQNPKTKPKKQQRLFLWYKLIFRTSLLSMLSFYHTSVPNKTIRDEYQKLKMTHENRNASI